MPDPDFEDVAGDAELRDACPLRVGFQSAGRCREREGWGMFRGLAVSALPFRSVVQDCVEGNVNSPSSRASLSRS